MKKKYSSPDVAVQEIAAVLMQFASTETDTVGVNLDDPQDTGNAMSRGKRFWDED